MCRVDQGCASVLSQGRAGSGSGAFKLSGCAPHWWRGVLVGARRSLSSRAVGLRVRPVRVGE